MKPVSVYIALGSNLGDRGLNLLDAISQLWPKVTVEQRSSVYETEPAYVLDQPRFYNMVLRGSTLLLPHELLDFLKSIERRMGRVDEVRYGPRPIDLDVLIYGDFQMSEPDLVIPHPRIGERAFVLVPLAEIAPELVIPGQQSSVAELARRSDMQGHVVQVRGGLDGHATGET